MRQRQKERDRNRKGQNLFLFLLLLQLQYLQIETKSGLHTNLLNTQLVDLSLLGVDQITVAKKKSIIRKVTQLVSSLQLQTKLGRNNWGTLKKYRPYAKFSQSCAKTQLTSSVCVSWRQVGGLKLPNLKDWLLDPDTFLCSKAACLSKEQKDSSRSSVLLSYPGDMIKQSMCFACHTQWRQENNSIRICTAVV